MRGLPRIFLLIRDKLNKFNNTGERLLGSIYCMNLKLLLNRVQKLLGTMLRCWHIIIRETIRDIIT